MLSLLIYFSLLILTLSPFGPSPSPLSPSLSSLSSLSLSPSLSPSLSLSLPPPLSLSLSLPLSFPPSLSLSLSLSLSRMLTRKGQLLQASSLESCQTGQTTFHSGTLIIIYYNELSTF